MAYFCYSHSGRIDLGFQTSAEAVRIAEESGDIYSKALAYACQGIFCYGRGLLEEAEKYLLRGIEFCERANEKTWNMVAHGHLAETYFAAGDFPEAENYYEKVYRSVEQTQAVPSWGNWAKVALARSKVMNKEKNVDLESLYAHSRNNRLNVTEGWISRYIGEILLNIDDLHMAEAEKWIQKSIEADQRNGLRFHLGNDYALYAEFFKRKGDRLKAQENLRKAIEILKECGADGWVSRYQKELGLIS